MPEPVKLTPVDDPLSSLRAGLARHAASVEAAKRAATELEAARQQPPPEPTEEPKP